MDKITVWHFTAEKGVLRNGDSFKLHEPLLSLEGDIVPCKRGYHGSPNLLDALKYAPGPHLYRRELSGVIVPHDDPIDKYAASKAVAVAYRDATPLLRIFARQCALNVIHLWGAPAIVREYLATGNEDKRAAAWDAAWAAVGAAARDAAYAAAGAAAADAAYAAYAAYSYAAAVGAWAAVGTVAWASARDEQRDRLEQWATDFIEKGILPDIIIPTLQGDSPGVNKAKLS